MGPVSAESRVSGPEPVDQLRLRSPDVLKGDGSPTDATAECVATTLAELIRSNPDISLADLVRHCDDAGAERVRGGKVWVELGISIWPAF